MTKIRLLHLLYSGPGGLGSYFMNFVNEDKEHRFEHHAFFYGIESLHKEYEDFSVRKKIPFLYQQRKSKIDLSYTNNLNAFIAQHKIDAVVFHTFSLTPGLPFIKNVRTVAIDHTSARFKTKLEWLYAAVLYMFSDIFVFFYEGQFDTLKKRFPLLRKKKSTLILPKVVDCTEFYPARQDKRVVGPFVIGMSARLTAGKRYDLILQALRQLRERGITVVLKVAGGGPALEPLKKQAVALDLTGQVEFAGVLQRGQMNGFYNSLDAYIHATEGETICYSIMEAQACGLAVAASDVSGVNTVLEHNRSAVLFANNDAAIAGAIEQIINNAPLRQALEKESLGIAKKAFAAPSGHIKLYNALAKR